MRRWLPTNNAKVIRSLVRRPPAPLDGYDGFRQRPFGLTPDQRFFYPSQSHVTVLNDVRRALQQREGLVVVTGAPGTGKTLLCRALLQDLEPGICVSIVLDPRVTVDDLLLHVLADFGVVSSPRQLAVAGAPTRHQLMRALQQFLASLIPLWGCAVLVIDEAQDLDPDVLEQLRLLLNFETDEAKLLQIVLIGQPELNELLRRPASCQLDERVARRCELQPLSTGEIAPYIDHRLSTARQLAGLTDVIVLEPENVDKAPPQLGLTFTPSAIRTFAAHSRGIPRAINVLCDRALDIIGEEGRTLRVDWRIARAAARRAHAKPSAPPRIRTAAKAAVAAAAIVVLAVLGLGVRTWGSDSAPLAPLPPPPFASFETHRTLPKSMGVKALPIVDSFNVRVASFRTASSAVALAAQLEATGLPALIRAERGGRHEVVVGPYLSHAEIAGVQSRLVSYGHPNSEVFVELEPAKPKTGRESAGGLMARQVRQP
ncbi:MAG: AAA family ATPase [Vicinamibacterales bacterium]